MLLSLLGILGFLAFVPQAVLSLFHLVSYSPIQQCGPFNVSFSGGSPPASLPLTLTVIPFNSTPLAFTVPDSTWDNSTSTGSYVTFLPLPEGVALMASLDDAAGNSAALVSDVIQIQPSNDTSCVSNDTITPTTFQLVDSSVSQCLPFSISRNTSSLTHPPSIRAFIPMGPSFTLQTISFWATQGVDIFTYTMSVARGFHVAMIFDDGQGNRQVSDLLSVGGGASSPSTCLLDSSAGSAAPAGQSSVQGLSSSTIIAISVPSASVVLIIIILGSIFIRHERRKRASLTEDSVKNQRQFNDSSPEVGLPVPPKPPRTPLGIPNSRFSVDPAERFLATSTKSPILSSARSSMFSPFMPSGVAFGKGKGRSSASRNASSKSTTIGSSAAHSFVDLDIAGLLEVASQRQAEVEALRGYPNASPVVVTSVPTSTVPSSPLVSCFSPSTPSLSQKGNHQEPDVPLSPLGRLSQVSLTSRGPSVPEADMTVTVPMSSFSSWKRAPSAPSRDAGGRTRSKPARF
ncbi:hypothetical protein B0F90DRAFT_1705116 [Multifurca ochricompacta]|uniref:Transmembrane protein n=1 Tax=Multifurca ochricompacta TaxID=376703 RepID=A0AAD4M9D9_9AGAM|nr:hypothetical protein B0F90DRAFT_1705116 [Multifurca ochricompacta]